MTDAAAAGALLESGVLCSVHDKEEASTPSRLPVAACKVACRNDLISVGRKSLDRCGSVTLLTLPMDFVFKPSLRLARDVTVRTLDDAAEFARTYVGPGCHTGAIALSTVSKRYPTRPARVLPRERFARGQ